MQAYSGTMGMTGEPDRPPSKMGPSVADRSAGMMATIGILMALENRHRTGRGQRVDTSLLECQVAMLAQHLTRYFSSGEVPVRAGSANSGLGVPYQAFQAADDWIVIASFNERMWRDCCAALDHPEWADDPRFRTADLRGQHRDLLLAMFTKVVAQHPVKYWEERLRARQVPATPVNSVAQIVAEEQVAAREMVVEIDVPGAGPIRVAGLPLKFSDTPGAVVSPPPRLGEHTANLLRRLGYSAEQIGDLAKRGVIGLDVPAE